MKVDRQYQFCIQTFFLSYHILFVSVFITYHSRKEGEVVLASPDFSIFNTFDLFSFEKIFVFAVYLQSISISFYVKHAWKCLKYFFGRPCRSNSAKIRLNAVLTMFSRLYFQHQYNYYLCNLTGVEILKQVVLVNTASLFCYGKCIGGLFLILK